MHSLPYKVSWDLALVSLLALASAQSALLLIALAAASSNYEYCWAAADLQGGLGHTYYESRWQSVIVTYCRYSFPGLSWNSLCGKFMIFTTDAAISRRVFSYNDPETLLMAVHPSGKNILGESNLAFMHGPPHKAIRKSFLSLFTRKALATYVELQDGIIREHLKEWQRVEGEREIRLFVRSVM